MPLLAVILLPLVVAISILSIEMLAHVARCRCQQMPVSRYSLVIKIGDAFKAETAILWGPGILLLEAIGTLDPSRQKESSLLPLYHSLTVRYPELFEGIGLSLYLEFLAKAELIAHRNGSVCLSGTGSDFLRVVAGEQRGCRYVHPPSNQRRQNYFGR